MAEERLLRALAEQVKMPLLQIAQGAELAIEEADLGALTTIRHISEAAIRLVDGFLLSSQEGALQLEPVSLSSVLQDTMYDLAPVAARNDCDVELSIAGKYAPVMAHRESLQAALLLLGYGLIESRPSVGTRHRVMLATHKNNHGLVAGVFDNQGGISSDAFRRGKAIYGSSKQPMPAVSAASAAGVFIADSLFASMHAPLRVTRHQQFTGLAATLYPSSQLQLVS